MLNRTIVARRVRVNTGMDSGGTSSSTNGATDNTERDASVLEPQVNPTADAVPVAADAPKPDLAKADSAIQSKQARSISMIVVAVLALLYTLYFARDFLLPIAFAVLLKFLFSPVVRALARLRVPTPLGAGVIVLTLLAVIGYGGFRLAGPVEGWAVSAPETLKTAELKLGKLIKPIERITRTAEQVATAASVTTGTARPTEVVVKGPSFVARAFGTTQRFVGSMFEVVVLLFFLLAAGDLFLQKLIKVLPNRGEKKKAVDIARETESSISTYLLTAASVNLGEAVVVTGIMYLWGMPSPELWGALVFVLEFIPYLGALAMTAILAVAALTVFDSVGHALLIPLSYLFINLIQGNLVSPLLLGHRLALNPVALFVGLAFWFWIWGIAGAFIAVPLLATFKIFCDHIDTLAPVGEFLGQRDEHERRATVRTLG
ncbi:MAG: AI-2E family transporter [Gemmatimonadaceae bacterium]